MTTTPVGTHGVALWTAADQALASITTFTLTVMVARAVNPAEFGSFSMVFLAFGFLIGMGRGLVTDALIIRHAGTTPVDLRAATSAAAGASLVFGSFMLIALMPLTVLLWDSVGKPLLTLGLCMPALLTQDALRRSFFAGFMPRKAFLNSLSWAILLLGGGMAISLSERGSSVVFLALWGLSGGLAGVLGACQARALPRPSAWRAWMGSNGALGWRLGMEFLISQGAFVLAMSAITAVASLSASGALRAGHTLLNPIAVLTQAMSSFGLPRMASPSASRESVGRTAGLLSMTGAGCAIAWTSVLFLLPDTVGRSLLGGSWAGAREVLLPLGCQVALIACMVGPIAAMKALGGVNTLLRLTVAQAGVLLTASIGGVVAFGATGAAWGLAAAPAVGTALIWWRLAVLLRSDKVSGKAR